MLIKEHHSLYIELFGDLKAKFHFMVHYERIIIKNGPVVKFSSMRPESKHTVLKMILSQSSCHKNILKSIAIRYELSLIRFHQSEYKEKFIKFGKDITNNSIYTCFPNANSVKQLSNISLTTYNMLKIQS